MTVVSQCVVTSLCFASMIFVFFLWSENVRLRNRLSDLQAQRENDHDFNMKLVDRINFLKENIRRLRAAVIKSSKK